MKRIHQALLITLLAFFLRAYLADTSPIEYGEQVYPEIAVNLNLSLRQGSWYQILDSTQNYEHPQFLKLVYAAGLLIFKPIENIIPFVLQELRSVSYWPKILSLRLISAFFGRWSSC